MKKAMVAVVAGAMMIGLVGIAPASAEDSADEAPVCDGRWPATVQGKPRTLDGKEDRTAYYVWHNANGWHLVTHSNGRVKKFHGTIESSEVIRAELIRSERRDSMTLTDSGLRFRLLTGQHYDGVHFAVGCSDSVTFSLKVNGRRIPAERIRLGKTGAAPSNPFTIERV